MADAVHIRSVVFMVLFCLHPVRRLSTAIRSG